MLGYIAEIQRQLVEVYGFERRTDVAQCVPKEGVPDGHYPMTINGKVDHVYIDGGRINCGNNEPRGKNWHTVTDESQAMLVDKK